MGLVFFLALDRTPTSLGRERTQEPGERPPHHIPLPWGSLHTSASSALPPGILPSHSCSRAGGQECSWPGCWPPAPGLCLMNALPCPLSPRAPPRASCPGFGRVEDSVPAGRAALQPSPPNPADESDSETSGFRGWGESTAGGTEARVGQWHQGSL